MTHDAKNAHSHYCALVPYAGFCQIWSQINNKDVVTEANNLKACENVDPGATAVEKESATWREDPKIAGGESSSTF